MSKNKKEKNNVLIERTIGRICPVYGIIPVASCFILNGLVYWGTQLLCDGRYHYEFSVPLDDLIPFRSGWVSIYVLSYVFWVTCYIMAARVNSKEVFYRFIFSELFSKLVCMAIFIAVPTTIVRPVVENNMDIAWLMQWIYNQDKPTNLFPSIHCLMSLMCFFAVYRSKEVKPWVKGLILAFALLVFASTQFTKQHYIVDVVGGVGVAIFAYEIGMHTSWYKSLMKVFEKINNKIYGKDRK